MRDFQKLNLLTTEFAGNFVDQVIKYLEDYRVELNGDNFIYRGFVLEGKDDSIVTNTFANKIDQNEELIQEIENKIVEYEKLKNIIKLA